ncbi:DUF5691 domain-containing protein [Melittangium boletus]|uniref:Uncharacterized protein n=1 Tax=Melittangium boletus DSM 14713 TaxID=1294270 RepID=A0A250IK32_9BACT|nr:DUF5691 domain-containing protein [Melittangium boletus]ATB32134.1 hypothetical protein MEBOL_005610 [Melittangium boletus DSM 14713]
MTELDALTRLASLGTSRAPDAMPTEGVEAMAFRALEGATLEKRVLLAAGVRAVARAAGQKPLVLEATSGKASEETLEICSPRVSALVRELLDGGDPDRDELLAEVFQRMALARRRLPPELLVSVLSRSVDWPRATLEPVLGERGRWLSHFRPGWRPAPTRQDAEAERVWTEGTFEERRTVLEDMRRVDPARARQWLKDTWSQEKAEHRARLLACFDDAALSLDDEPSLEQGRQDRSAAVREVARHLLARLPGSAFSRRMRERAHAVLQWGGPALRIQWPAKWDAEADKDGLDKPPAGVGQSEHWLVRILECVPLPEWEKQFQTPPERIAAAAARTDDYAAISEGWAHAFRLEPSSAWASALFDSWSSQRSNTLSTSRAQSLAHTVFEQLPTAERASRTLSVLRGTTSLPWREHAVALTPAPWPRELGMAWINALYDTPHAVGPLWHAVRALPAECLSAAAELRPLPQRLGAYRYVFERLQQLVSFIRILHEELKP